MFRLRRGGGLRRRESRERGTAPGPRPFHRDDAPWPCTPATRRVFPVPRRRCRVSRGTMGTRGAIRDHAILMAGGGGDGLPLWLALMSGDAGGARWGFCRGEALQGNLDTLAPAARRRGAEPRGNARHVRARRALGRASDDRREFSRRLRDGVRPSFPPGLSGCRSATLSFPVEARMIPTFEVAAALRLCGHARRGSSCRCCRSRWVTFRVPPASRDAAAGTGRGGAARRRPGR